MRFIGLDTRVLGRRLIYYKEIYSTQSEIWRLYKENIENGTLVIADSQVKGKRNSWKNLAHRRKWEYCFFLLC